jgi:hypothetical protein
LGHACPSHDFDTKIEDLTINAWMSAEIPVLDAIRTDVTCAVDGIELKAAVDYIDHSSDGLLKAGPLSR